MAHSATLLLAACAALLSVSSVSASFCTPAGQHCEPWTPCCPGYVCGGRGTCVPKSKPPPVIPPPVIPPPVIPPPPTCTPTNGAACDVVSCCNSGDRCVLNPGASSPVCQPPPVTPRCISTGNSGCGSTPCCDTNDQCAVPAGGVFAVCAPPPPVTPPGPCACKKPLSITFRFIGQGPVTVDLSASGTSKKSKKSSKSKSSKKSKDSKKSKSSKKSKGPSLFGGMTQNTVTLNTGDTFTINGPFKSSTIVLGVDIHTSCSDVLGIGQTFCGLLEIVAGTNTQGTSLCPVTTPQKKSSCPR